MECANEAVASCVSIIDGPRKYDDRLLMSEKDAMEAAVAAIIRAHFPVLEHNTSHQYEKDLAWLLAHEGDSIEKTVAAIVRLNAAHYPSPPLAVLRQAKEALEAVDILTETTGTIWRTSPCTDKVRAALNALNSLLAGEPTANTHANTAPASGGLIDNTSANTDGENLSYEAWVKSGWTSPPPPSEPTDKEMLDWLDGRRTHYSMPPFRAVTGWEWSVVDESGNTDLRSAIRAAMARRQETGGEKK
jgi:hypothetical protein